jgi:small subunit ribosomal protein S20
MPQGTPVKHKKRSKSVLKNARQAERRTAINRMNRTRVRTAMRRMRTALAAGDALAAEKAAPETFAELDKAIRKGTLHENTANRYKSRLQLALNGLKTKKA